MQTTRFVFPARGFYSVAEKVGEADFFLDKMLQRPGFIEFRYYFSAFLSAARSVTFCTQSVMAHYPNFNEWYESRRSRLQNNRLAKFFVTLRNHSQKIGNIPITQTYHGSIKERAHTAHIVPTVDFKEVPQDDIKHLSVEYFTEIISILQELYTDYRIYVDPRAIFSLAGLAQLGWSIEDLEESLGLPRGYTDIPWPSCDKDELRIKLLSKQGGDEMMEQYFSKYLSQHNNT